MATSLEHRLRRLEHGRPQPMIVIIRRFSGVTDEPIRIGVSNGGQDWLREASESVDAFRRRALSGPHDVGAAAVVVLRERNADVPSPTFCARPQGGYR